MLNISRNLSQLTIQPLPNAGTNQTLKDDLLEVLSTWKTQGSNEENRFREDACEVITTCFMDKATRLDLSEFGISDFPPPMWEHLTHVEELYLGDNKLSVFPEGVEQLASLKELDLASNAIQALPPQVGQLKQLTYLNLCHNQLRTLPNEFAQLEELLYLDLDTNQFDVFPKVITYLHHLKDVDLSDNQLTRFPTELVENVKDLETFQLGGNPIPDEDLPAIAVPNGTELTRCGEPISVRRTAEEGYIYIRVSDSLYSFLEDGCEYIFKDKEGRVIGFEVAEEQVTAWYYQQEIGKFTWREKLGKLLLTHIDTDEGYKRVGIGTAMVKIITKEAGSVFVRRATGQTYQDGSESVNESPGFYKSLVKKGLANWFDDGFENFEEDDSGY